MDTTFFDKKIEGRVPLLKKDVASFEDCDDYDDIINKINDAYRKNHERQMASAYYETENNGKG